MRTLIHRASGRSPLFRTVRRLLAASVDPAHGTHDESRRRFLKGAAGASALALSAATLPGCSVRRLIEPERGPRIVIVGAGLAGLTAAYRLKQAGFSARLFEASNRIGGRMFTGRDVVGTGLTTELGAEFIDTNHEAVLGLVRELGLELLDTKTHEEERFAARYHFGGNDYTEAQVIAAFKPIARRIERDYDALGEVIDYKNEGGGRALDTISIAEYLDRIGARGMIRALIDSAYTTEMGLDIGEQSALNLVCVIGTDLRTDKFRPFGASDERFKIVGGNDTLTTRLAHEVRGQLELGACLTAVRPSGTGYVLTFEEGGRARDVRADIVILAVPFSVLRDVEIDVALPPLKRRAIRELSYGTNAKIMIGFRERFWRDAGMSGEFITDASCLYGWDSSRLQAPAEGSLTVFLAGRAGLHAGLWSAEVQGERFLRSVAEVFPDAERHASGRFARFHWPGYQYTKGSYSLYRPGQWTTIAGVEGEPVGDLYFAGEHCSYEFQGFMNGAADSAERAVRAITAKHAAHARLREHSARQAA